MRINEIVEKGIKFLKQDLDTTLTKWLPSEAYRVIKYRGITDTHAEAYSRALVISTGCPDQNGTYII